MNKNYAIILIGGSGSRFSIESPKQFFKLNAREIVYYSIQNFLQNKNIDTIIIVVNSNDEKFLIENVVKKYFYQEYQNHKIFSCIGGERRIDSAFCGLSFIKKNFENCENVFIHDGCRPLFSQNLINNLIEKIEEKKYDCMFPALKITEAIKHIDKNIVRSQNRDFFYTAQTPQIFQFKKIIECFEKNNIDNDYFVNDESGFLEKNGYKISFINGEKENIKITFPEDLKLAEFFLKTNL